LNKVVCVPAFFAPVGKDKTVKVPTGEKTTGFFGGEKDVVRKEKQWIQTGFSDCVVDSERLTEDLNSAVENLNQNGYEVLCVSSITSGDYSWKTYAAGDSSYGHGYGYGFSYTSSLIITAKKLA
jgi:hypothetical protein